MPVTARGQVPDSTEFLYKRLIGWLAVAEVSWNCSHAFQGLQVGEAKNFRDVHKSLYPRRLYAP